MLPNWRNLATSGHTAHHYHPHPFPGMAATKWRKRAKSWKVGPKMCPIVSWFLNNASDWVSGLEKRLLHIKNVHSLMLGTKRERERERERESEWVREREEMPIVLRKEFTKIPLVSCLSLLPLNNVKYALNQKMTYLSLCARKRKRERVCVWVCNGLFCFLHVLFGQWYVRTFFLFFKLGYLFRLYSVYLCVCIRS